MSLGLSLVVMLCALGAPAAGPRSAAPAPAPACADKACHGPLLRQKHVHPPAAEEGGCESCHTATGEAHPGGKPGFGLAAEGPALCGACHEEVARAAAAKTPHPPATEDCLACHDPHGSDERRMLKARMNDLCFQCHDAEGFKLHVVRGVDLGSSHPLAGGSDPARKGEAFTCASCHDAHGSDAPALWRYEAQSAFDLCGHCHRMGGGAR
ncbi:MAG: hypothetical protein HZC42_07095 [Candidatus Eisenbacteria bacterium]|nr:hypothetical protein [Candidatus Eisenbacteria bacterium]